MDGFVHLHVHSHYSLLDGAGRVAGLLQTANGHGMDTLALTDHGNLFGAVDFYESARKAGIRPILGMEAYISPTTRLDRSMGNPRTASYHMLLLAMNDAGWQNLKRLSSRAFLEGFYYRPRVDRELLSQFSEGLLATSACLGGEIPAALLEDNYDKALRIGGEYAEIFGRDRFFIEVQNQGMEEQTRINGDLVRLARELGVGVVGTNDVHFLSRNDKAAHEVLTCISTGKTLNSGGALEYSPELYLKSPEEMRHALREFPEAADNTLRIAEMCQLDLDFSQAHLPRYDVPDNKTDDEYLAELARAGLAERFAGRDVPEEYTERLDWELKVIAEKGYSSYFLVVNDFVRFARENDIPSAPRGSAVSALLSYALKIAEVDPLRYGLLFERFTDPQREEAPDIDIDICQEGRSRVLQYVREKYGHVAQIVTYGTLKARAVLRDVGRVLEVPLPEVDAICKLVPNELKMTLEKALDVEPELKKLYDTQPLIHDMIEHGKRLEGLCRHTGVHAAGVIVCDEELEDIVPLYRQGDSDDQITQWDGPTCEKVGLMKMDFLGLRTLTILQRCRELVRDHTGEDIDPETLPLDDQATYELFRQGHTDGVFQFESDGMKNVLRAMQPEQINDLIAANAMYRPGPMELIPSYCSRKNEGEAVPSVHPLVDDILAETYGIMCYQEQVMLVLNRLGKLPLNRALTLIKAISKKKQKVIESERPNFLQGAQDNGIALSEAEQLFELILKFAGYGFNKAHSTRYAIVAYQTAWFKVHYPRQFLAATLTFECGDTDKVVQYMAEAKRMGISIAPPDVNTCGPDFAVDGDKVRFGLAAVKGVGHRAVEAIVEARDEIGSFENLYHFCEHVDLHAVNRTAIEALIKCGAFDALGAHRSAMVEGIDQAIQLGQQAAEHRRSGQLSFFGEGILGADAAEEAPRFPNVEPWSKTRLLAAEKETLGFYVSSHPLVEHGRVLTELSFPSGVSLGHLHQWADRYPQGTPIRLGCMISSVRTRFTRTKNEKMARLTLEDITGKCEAVVFPRTYRELGEQIADGAIVFLTGTVDRSRDRPELIVEELDTIEDAPSRFAESLQVDVPLSQEGVLKDLHQVVGEHPGNCTMYLRVRGLEHPDVVAIIQAGRDCCIQPSRRLLEDLEDLLGDQEHIRLNPRPVQLKSNGRNRFRTRAANAG